jgi:hypothetical protein
MIDRQKDRIVVECDSCDETRASEDGETFTDFWNNAKRDGWKAKRIGADWLHACPQCEV